MSSLFEALGELGWFLGEATAVLADHAQPGQLLSTSLPAADDDLVVERLGKDVPAVYSIRSRT